MRSSSRRRRRTRLTIAVLLVLGFAAFVLQPLPWATAATCPCSVWASSATPGTLADPDNAAVELGMKFRADTSGFVTGVRFYKAATNTGTHLGRLWSASGTQLASATFSGETASGWQQVSFTTPVAISANTTYVVSYYAPVGHYSVNNNFFTSGVDNAPLHALANGVDGGNGVYRYGSGGGFPNSSFSSSNYWVDVVFDTSGTDTTPPTVTGRSPSPNASGVATGANVTATFSEAVQSSTISFTLTGPGGAGVPAAMTYDGPSQTATLNPNADLATSTSYTATVSGAKDLAGNTMTAPVTWSFTTAAAAGACPCTIWPSSATPGTVAADDDSAVELGVRFRSDVNGYITGLRFYKASTNTGTHIANLWTNSGTKLATANFTGETASGWQLVNFTGPVPIVANTTYVASYYAPVGRYSFNDNFFTAAVNNPPLHALANGTDGANGVYHYGASAFPTDTFQASNYWVDVVMNQSANDTTPPTVVGRSPAPNATGVAISTNVTATFSEPVQSSTISFTLTGPGGAGVPAAVTYDGPTQTATLNPNADLAASTSYTATLSGAKDLAGNTMATVTWSFTTGAPPPPAPDQGPGGPILVVGTPSNPFGRYSAEILRSEGLNEFATTDISAVTATMLNSYDVVILGQMALTPAQVTMLTDWVNAGGNLIAMRPDAQLASLLGLTTASGTLSDAYLKVSTTSGPGVGITDQTIQFHGAADRYTLSGATAVATLYSNATTATSNPAVTLRSVGASGGQAGAFTFDLNRSIVYTRQGNPAFAGQERDGQTPIRSDDQFYPSYVDLNKVAIPQADEQQRLLVNLIEQMNRDRKPLPKFWYLPGTTKAVVIATGDDHGHNGTAGRFDQYLANSPAGCVVDDWQCPRFTSYIYPSTPLTNSDAAAYDTDGFEVGLHPQNNCTNYSPSSLQNDYDTQLATWTQKYTSLQSPVSNRYHCLVWSDWSSQPEVEKAHGIRLDVNYYYWPPNWVNDRPGFFTGAGLPQRFARTDGTMIDVYQATTQMTDESGQSYPFTPDTLLDRAQGPLGYYGAFTANMHTDDPSTFQSDQLLASAFAHGVPLVTARQMLTWLDGRNASSFGSISGSGTSLQFTISVGTGADRLTAMVPTVSSGGTLSTLTRDGSAVSFTRQTVKGLEYALFAAAPGSYSATYTSGGGAAAISQTQELALANGTAVVSWDTSRAADSRVLYGVAPDALTQQAADAVPQSSHDVTLRGLRGRTTYYYRVQSRDSAGHVAVSPAAGEPPATFTTPTPDTTSPTVSAVSATPLPDGTAVIGWRTGEASDSRVQFGTSPAALNQSRIDAHAVTSHNVVLTHLRPGAVYWYRVVSTDRAGNATTTAPLRLIAANRGVVDTTTAQFRQGSRDAATTIGRTADGELRLARGHGSTTRFTSRVMDSWAMVTWDRAFWKADVPAGTSLRISVRAGSTSEPDGSWTRFTPLSGSGARLASILGSSRYIQYRVEMVTSSSSRTPTLESIGFTYSGGTSSVGEGES
jgi:methionine-rich copper-binding protein CopC